LELSQRIRGLEQEGSALKTTVKELRATAEVNSRDLERESTQGTQLQATVTEMRSAAEAQVAKYRLKIKHFENERDSLMREKEAAQVWRLFTLFPFLFRIGCRVVT
jgi:predicted  nucleic acid-binding Zn-ribbon protein